MTITERGEVGVLLQEGEDGGAQEGIVSEYGSVCVYFEITLPVGRPELSDQELLRAAEQAGTFDFWTADREDIYNLEDGEAV